MRVPSIIYFLISTLIAATNIVSASEEPDILFNLEKACPSSGEKAIHQFDQLFQISIVDGYYYLWLERENLKSEMALHKLSIEEHTAPHLNPALKARYLAAKSNPNRDIEEKIVTIGSDLPSIYQAYELSRLVRQKGLKALIPKEFINPNNPKQRIPYNRDFDASICKFAKDFILNKMRASSIGIAENWSEVDAIVNELDKMSSSNRRLHQEVGTIASNIWNMIPLSFVQYVRQTTEIIRRLVEVDRSVPDEAKGHEAHYHWIVKSWLKYYESELPSSQDSGLISNLAALGEPENVSVGSVLNIINQAFHLALFREDPRVKANEAKVTKLHKQYFAASREGGGKVHDVSNNPIGKWQMQMENKDFQKQVKLMSNSHNPDLLDEFLDIASFPILHESKIPPWVVHELHKPAPKTEKEDTDSDSLPRKKKDTDLDVWLRTSRIAMLQVVNSAESYDTSQLIQIGNRCSKELFAIERFCKGHCVEGSIETAISADYQEGYKAIFRLTNDYQIMMREGLQMVVPDASQLHR